MSTSELYLTDEEIAEFVADTKAETQTFYGYEDQEYGVCPYITFYVYHSKDDFLHVCHEVIELHQELQALIDSPYKKVYNSKTQAWVKATPEKLSREFLQHHAKLHADDGYESLWLGATDMESPAASARWAIFAVTPHASEMRYASIKITFRDNWYQNNKATWHAFVQRWVARLQPEQCYSGYEIGTTTIGVMGAYESDVMERICADHFYGLDIDHPQINGFHFNDDEDGYVNHACMGSGIRTPTWSFLLSPLWRTKLGKSVAEVKAQLAHPDIRISEIPYSIGKHNPNGEPALWIQLGELSLYPVDQGVPELPVLANALIKPIRCDLLQLFTLDPWADDPNPRFDFENGPLWMARFDADSNWPNASQRKPIQPAGQAYLGRCVAGGRCPKTGHWHTPAKENALTWFQQGDVMPDFPESTYGATIWYWNDDQG
ncbi:hypothetical protein N8I74_02580 [Chitiniphilus purpureus]|uniref:DUF3396 domain-containing protein n=1 Tax=Chitiniphilus purpureus TaxID=2981137 RepID=A0ABY6DQC9_9NEIS|nr:hypothetical protein [Chitiniphilus sp. CD1]UXY15923.1 hypothetical protein N8I74_02580 [Chitiniphilus sp. CD1]